MLQTSLARKSACHMGLGEGCVDINVGSCLLHLVMTTTGTMQEGGGLNAELTHLAYGDKTGCYSTEEG